VLNRFNVLNDPVNKIDPLGLRTWGIDFSATAAAGGGGTGGYTFVIDSRLNIGIIEHSGGGGLGGATASVAAQLQETNASSIYDLGGSSTSAGGSIGPGIQATGEIVIGSNYTGDNWGIAAGPGLPVELHGMWEHSNLFWSDNLIAIVLGWLLDSNDDPCK